MQHYEISDTTVHVRQPFFEEPQAAQTFITLGSIMSLPMSS